MKECRYNDHFLTTWHSSDNKLASTIIIICKTIVWPCITKCFILSVPLLVFYIAYVLKMLMLEYFEFVHFSAVTAFQVIFFTETTFNKTNFWRLLGCLTGVCLTIQIEQVMFDDLQTLGCSTRIMFNVEQQLSNKTLIENNFCPRLCSINVYFD